MIPMGDEYGHKPVLLAECLQALVVCPEGVYVDGTVGRGGHSLEILRRLTTGRLLAIDRDEEAVTAARQRLAPFGGQAVVVHGNFKDLRAILREQGVRDADGMLFDLGVSSPQLDEGARGFSYQRDAPLDMRMDRSAPLDARQIVNTWSGEELQRILYAYGEERYAPQIASAIVKRRSLSAIQTTGELAEIIASAMPSQGRREKQHPAKRSFQAIRIAVNGELDALPPMLEAAVEGLRPGGRLAVITFHSLEDRIVKQTFRTWAAGCTCPPQFPVCVCGKRPRVQLVTKKPVTASEAELSDNPRSRSAKLRVVQKAAVDGREEPDKTNVNTR